MFKQIAGVVVAASLLCGASAQAADYRLDFTATSVVPFDDAFGPAPFNFATGYAIFSADSLGSNWTAVKDFDLTIGNAHYTRSDVGVDLRARGAFVGGLLNDFRAINNGTNDFWIYLNNTQSTGLIYASVSKFGFWESYDIKQTVSAVPEPETYGMFLAGLGLLGVVARRRKA